MRQNFAWIGLGICLAAGDAQAQHQAAVLAAARPTTTPTSAPVVSTAALPAPDATLDDAVLSLASRAGVIFVGQVTSIKRTGGVVEVDFAVQQMVQGSIGSNYTLREWAGLWPQGEQRYVPGQRAMVFLHPASGAGLSSPVDGMEGIVPLVPMGADQAPLLDVRRLATRVQRSVGQPLAGDAVTLDDAVSVIRAGTSSAGPRLRPLPIISRPHTVNGQGSEE